MTTKEHGKAKRDRQLHIIFFVDSNQARSLTFSLKRFFIFVGTSVVLLGLGVYEVSRAYQTRRQLASREQHIRELKAGLLATSIISHRALSPESLSLSSEARERTERIAELSDELLKDFSPAVPKANQAVALSAKKVEEKPLESSVPIAVQTPPAVAVTKPPQTVTALAPTASKVPTAAPLRSLVGFYALQLAEDEPGTTSIQFDIQNLAKNKKTPLSGWVCAVVEVENGNGTVPRAAPATVTLTSQNAPYLKSCQGGEYVKFSRLRPTELIAPASKENIRRLTLYFSENTTGRIFSESRDIK